MNNILVIQLARMGDIIQTTHLLNGIKASYPDHTISLLVDSAQNNIAQRCFDADEILTINLDDLSSVVNSSNDLNCIFPIIHDICSCLHNSSYKHVVNLNYSHVAALLSTLPCSQFQHGYWMCGQNNNLGKDWWFSYFNAFVKNAPLAPFNLVDVFYFLMCPRPIKNATLPMHTSSRDLSAAHALLEENSITDNDLIVGLQLATRNRQRQWPIEHFSDLAVSLLKNPSFHLMLLGSDSDTDLGREFEQRLLPALDLADHKRVHNYIGQTDIGMLCGLLRQADLLVTGDTGTMHLAASQNCPVVSLFFGPALSNYTGPYGENHWVIQAQHHCSPCIEDYADCNDAACRWLIKPEYVLDIAEHILIDKKLEMEVPGNICISKTCMTDWGVINRQLVNGFNDLQAIQHLCYREMGISMLLQSQAESTIRPESLEHYGLRQQSGSPLLKDLTRQCRKIMHDSYQGHEAILSNRMNTGYSFWHALIDYYYERTQLSNAQQAQTQFAACLLKSSTLLSHMSETYH